MANWNDLLDKDPAGLLKKLTEKEKAPRDPVPGYRKKLIQNINKAAEAHKGGKARSGIYRRIGDFHRVQLKAGRNPVRTMPLNGNEFNMVPSERFADFCTGFAQHVESGGFDAELRAAYEGKGTASASTPAKPRKQRNETPEQKAARMAKRAATLAAKKKN